MNIRASSYPSNLAGHMKYTKSMHSISESRHSLANQKNKNLHGSISHKNIQKNESKIYILSKFLKSI